MTISDADAPLTPAKPATDTAPLRVGVLVDGFQQPRWVCRLLEAIRDAPFSTLCLTLVARVPDEHPHPAWHDTLRTTYMRIDERRYARKGDAMEPCDIRPHSGSVLRELDADERALQLSGIDAQTVLAEGLDVVLCLGRRALRDGCRFARYGAWTLSLGVGPDGRPTNGMAEFLMQAPTTTIDVALLDEHGDVERFLIRSRGPTDTLSFYRSRNRLYSRGVPILLNELRQLHFHRTLSPREPVAAIPPATIPGNARTFASLAIAGARDVVHRTRDHLAREQWFFAYQLQKPEEELTLDFSRFHRVTPPRDRMWADPFAVRSGDRAWVFVEELRYREKKGVIAVLEVDARGHWSESRRVLERPGHLSYPCLFRWNESWYMVPESSEDESVELYRCVVFPDRWEHVQTIMKGIRAVDTTIFERDGRWWLFTSTASYRSMFDELSVYHADTPLGPWQPFRRNPVVIDIIGGRCAGRPFQRQGRWYRAVQDGSRRYGYGMELREIVTLTPDEWVERTVRTIAPDWSPGLVGTHTLNAADGLTVIDGLRYRWGAKPKR